MSQEETIKVITVESLLAEVTALRKEGRRLVQIGAIRLPDAVELTYSFDLDSRLANLRVNLPGEAPHVPSITSVYFAAVLYENEIHDLFNVQVDGLALDFKGNFYKTAVKHAFATPPPVKPAAPAAPAAPATPAAPAAPAATNPTS